MPSCLSVGVRPPEVKSVHVQPLHLQERKGHDIPCPFKMIKYGHLAEIKAKSLFLGARASSHGV